MISSTFIRRPRLALVISIVISIAGLIALSVIPVAQFPDIVPPQVQVTATYPGASAAAVEASIGQIVEGQVNGVERMIYMKSTSVGDGSYVLNVSFEVGVDADISTVNVTNRVNRSLALLPPEVQRIGVSVRNQSSSLLQVVAIYSPKGTRDALFLSNYATVSILDTLRRVRGVGEASQFGNQEYSSRIWLGLDRMASLGITEQDVIKALQSQNVQAAVGRVGSAPLIDEVQLQLNISTQGQLTSAEEFGNVIVRAAPDGGIVRINDIARVELGAKTSDLSRATTVARAPASASIRRPAPTRSQPPRRSARRWTSWRSRFPDDVAFDVMYDTTVFVQATIEKVIHNADGGLCARRHRGVHLPRQSSRATLIPIIAVPVALVGTFAVMLAFGFSANTVSLLVVGAGHRNRRRRRHRRCRGGGAQAGSPAASHSRRGDRGCHSRSYRTYHRHYAGAAVGLRADRLHSGYHRAALQAVRRRRVGCHGHFRHQRAHSVARLVHSAAAPPGAAQGHYCPHATWHRPELRRIRRRWCARWRGAPSSRACWWRVLRWRPSGSPVSSLPDLLRKTRARSSWGSATARRFVVNRTTAVMTQSRARS